MAATVGRVQSTKKVVQGGNPIFEELPAASAVTPGAVLMRDSANKVKEATGATVDVTGVADIIASLGQNVDTDIAAGATVRKAEGSFLFRGIIANGQAAMNAGALLKPAAAGELVAFVKGTDPDYQAVARLAEDAADASGGSVKALCIWIAG